MQLQIATVVAAILAPHVSAQTLYSVSYDSSHDVASTPTDSVLCSAQLNSEGYANYGSIPTFPSIGGFSNITANPAYCGQCVVLEYAGNGRETHQLGGGFGVGALGGGD